LISEFGGLAKPMPVYFNFFLVMMLSSVGLPALNGFVGEFLILVGTFQVKYILTIIATLGVILAAVYLLYMFRRVFFGDVTNPENARLKDLKPIEVWSVLPLAIMAFVIGIFPTMFLGRITPDSEGIVKRMQQVEQLTYDELAAVRPEQLETGGVTARLEGGAR
jgi:NADH-quinone oxidoreductase subunit M